MPKLVLIIISAIITIIAIFISIVYCCNKKFRSFPFYFNIMFTFSIAANNIIRLLPVSNETSQKYQDKSQNNPSIMCKIQAISLTFLDKYMLTLMTVYSLVAYIGFYRIELFKIHQKSIFIILTIISIIISVVCTTVFYLQGLSTHSEFCYVKTRNDIKIWADSIVTSILLLINLFCITRIMKIHIIRKEINKNIIDGKENGFDDH